MKGFYLAVSIFFTVILLIVAFENISSILAHFYFFFFPLGPYDGFFLVVGIEGIGIIIGVFLTLFITHLQNKDEEEPGSDIF